MLVVVVAIVVAGSGIAAAQATPQTVITETGKQTAENKVSNDEDDFLRVTPLPEGLENLSPIPGAVNVPFADCVAFWPEGYRAFRAESIAAQGHARKRDIYAWLRAKQAFEMRDCGCSGKVPPWGQVEDIYAALKTEHGEVQIKHTADYDAQANVLTAAVEKLCGGRF